MAFNEQSCSATREASKAQWRHTGASRNSPGPDFFCSEYVEGLIPELNYGRNSPSRADTQSSAWSLIVQDKTTEIIDDYGLAIDLKPYSENRTPKTNKHTFSPIVNKLYIRCGDDILITFSFKRTPPASSIIRAACFFLPPDQISEPIKCCEEHMAATTGPRPELYIRACHRDAAICTDLLSKHLSVTVPCKVQFNTTTMAMKYNFPCYTSEVTKNGVVQTIFTLESASGDLLGRCTINIRVCSSPGRDRGDDEEKEGPVCGRSRGQKRKASAVSEPTEEPSCSHPERRPLTIYASPILHNTIRKIAATLEEEMTKLIHDQKQ